MQKVERKIVLVTRQTQMDGLRRRFNTAGQAKFYIERAFELDAMKSAAPTAGGATLRSRKAAEAGMPVEASPAMKFRSVEREDDLYRDAISRLRKDLGDLLPLQVVQRELLPTLSFGPADIVVTVGQDGLVANTAKYAINRPIVAINPDPATIDGILLPFTVDRARDAVLRAMNNTAKLKQVTLAEASLNDGQRLLAFNDLFIGARTHVSARYRIDVGDATEPQSSSGVIVSTGAGSTGWLSSIYNMAAGLMRAKQGPKLQPLRLAWDDARLAYAVREPFVSKTSGANIVAGLVEAGHELVIESAMPQNGVIFSDGVEADFLRFDSGAIARIRAAREKALLVAG